MSEACLKISVLSVEARDGPTSSTQQQSLTWGNVLRPGAGLGLVQHNCRSVPLTSRLQRHVISVQLWLLLQLAPAAALLQACNTMLMIRTWSPWSPVTSAKSLQLQQSPIPRACASTSGRAPPGRPCCPSDQQLMAKSLCCVQVRGRTKQLQLALSASAFSAWALTDPLACFLAATLEPESVSVKDVRSGLECAAEGQASGWVLCVPCDASVAIQQRLVRRGDSWSSPRWDVRQKAEPCLL
jgi:hypothetical protein